jgi:hypothetical protein
VSAAAARPPDLRLVEWAGPDLLEAAQLALPVMKAQLLALLEIGCDQTEGAPDRETLDAELVPEVTALEEAIDATERAIERALSEPADEGGPAHG